jgi:aldehyde:ferredoxin oxidoreductase
MLKGGYCGKILRINLASQKISKENLKEDVIRNFLGGRGLGSKILYDEVSASVDPYSPKNKIIFATGPLTGTSIPSVSRFAVISKSPLTGGCLHSLAGGFWGAELKKAGYDAIIVEDVSESPVYIWVYDEHVEIRPASGIWGLKTIDAERLIKKEIRDEKAEILGIGPAGENLVRYACVVAGMTSYTSAQAARGGGGAIMGSKKLKAIAVRGTGVLNVANPKKLKELTKEIVKLQTTKVKGTVSPEGFSRWGTPGGLEYINELGIFPTKNFQTGTFEEAENIGGNALDKYVLKHTSCYMCPIRCRKIRLAKNGPSAGNVTDGPEYETCWAFGGQIGNNDPQLIIEADNLCDSFGLDTISTGNVIGFVMELYQRGLLTASQCDNLDLRWGSREAVVNLIRKISYREGVGAVLAEGVKKAAEIFGGNAAYYAMHVKGLELPAYDPRGARAHGLGIATSNRGGCHERGFATQELFGIPYWVDRFSIEGKGKLTKENQDRTAIYDSMIACVFSSFMTGGEIYALALQAVTGIEEFGNFNNLMLIGERIWNIERAFNIREGFDRKDDTLPKRFLEEPMPEGGSKGYVAVLDPLLDEYYLARGWDVKTGLPTRRKLEELGLEYVADELEKLCRLR